MPCLIGRAKADGTYLARYLRCGDNPTDLVSMLRITRARGYDTWMLLGALLQCDWVELNPDAAILSVSEPRFRSPAGLDR